MSVMIVHCISYPILKCAPIFHLTTATFSQVPCSKGFEQILLVW